MAARAAAAHAMPGMGHAAPAHTHVGLDTRGPQGSCRVNSPPVDTSRCACVMRIRYSRPIGALQAPQPRPQRARSRAARINKLLARSSARIGFQPAEPFARMSHADTSDSVGRVRSRQSFAVGLAFGCCVSVSPPRCPRFCARAAAPCDAIVPPQKKLRVVRAKAGPGTPTPCHVRPLSPAGTPRHSAARIALQCLQALLAQTGSFMQRVLW